MSMAQRHLKVLGTKLLTKLMRLDAGAGLAR